MVRGCSHHDPLAVLAAVVLIPDPLECLAQAAVERCVRFPLEDLLDETVVAVAAGDATRGGQIVTSSQRDAGDRLHFGDELVDGNELAGAEVDRRGDQVVAVRDHVDAFDAICDVHEASGLMAVSPNLDLAAAVVDGLDDFPADRRRGFLAPAVPGAVWAIHVVETGNEGLEVSLWPILLTEHLGDKLFPAVATLGHCRVGVGLLQRPDGRVLLEQGVVGARGRREEVPPNADPAGSLNHVGVDEDAAETLYAEPLDEAHSAHPGGQAIDLHRAVTHALASLLIATIEVKILDPRNAQVPVVKWLLVHRANAREASFMKVLGQVPADEAAAAGDGDEVVFLQFG